jgi:hypothetical protein
VFGPARIHWFGGGSLGGVLIVVGRGPAGQHEQGVLGGGVAGFGGVAKRVRPAALVISRAS